MNHGKGIRKMMAVLLLWSLFFVSVGAEPTGEAFEPEAPAALEQARDLQTEGEQTPEEYAEAPDREMEGAAEEAVEGRLSGLIIGIDPGHQAEANYDQEPVAPGSKKTKAKVSSGTKGRKTRIPEHEVNLQVSLKLRDALVAEGAQVIMVREAAEVDISNIERAAMMNEAGADLVLRIHCNGVDSSKPKGMSVYVRKTGTKAAESREAARCVLAGMLETTGAVDRGVVRSNDYSGLNWSEVPSMLIEMGFLTNPEEEQLLISGEYQDKLVEGMVEGVAAFFEIRYS